jgi:hypothetical protein
MRRFACPPSLQQSCRLEPSCPTVPTRAVIDSERLAIIGIDIVGVPVGSIRTIASVGAAIAGIIDICSPLAAARRRPGPIFGHAGASPAHSSTLVAPGALRAEIRLVEAFRKVIVQIRIFDQSAGDRGVAKQSRLLDAAMPCLGC